MVVFSLLLLPLDAFIAQGKANAVIGQAGAVNHRLLVTHQQHQQHEQKQQLQRAQQTQQDETELKESEVQATEAANATMIAPFGKEDTAHELQSHAARTQDTLVDAVENAEVAEIKRAVFRALTRLRAAE